MSDQLFLALFVGVIIVERVVELFIAHRNEKWILQQGGKEVGAGLSKIIVVFHMLWFAAFLTEGFARSAELLAPQWLAITVLVLLQAGRYWCIRALGKFWNTKVLVLPDARLARRGPYKWIRHPNYLIVILEIFCYPALFGCFWTAILGSAVNGVLLRKRIAQEVAALNAHTDYEEIFA